MNPRTESLFTENYQSIPYWWNDRPDWFENNFPELPSEVDIVVIGSGYTGLNAGLQTSRAGLSTLILDKNSIGWGCSSRNGGQISNSIKPTFKTLCNRYGSEVAVAIVDESDKSLHYMHSLVKEEKFECQLLKVGRFHGAHNPRMYDWLARESKTTRKGREFYMVSNNELGNEVNSDFYFGGAVYPNHCSIDVGKYLSNLAQRVKEAGATLIGKCEVLNYVRSNNGFLIETTSGFVKARKVVLATNGYTGKVATWHQKRIIPVGSNIIATEPIQESVLDRLMPKNRVYSDTRNIVYYYRAMPNRQGILFGGRVPFNDSNPKKSAVRLQRELVRIFPELTGIKISRSWVGYVGFTFDKLMHCGQNDGVYFAGGYCGSGVAMASYLGMCLGRQVAEINSDISPFQSINFPTRSYYFGIPWFVVPTTMVFRIMDKFGISGRKK